MEYKKLIRPTAMLALCVLTFASCKKTDDAAAMQQGQVPELAVLTVGSENATIDRSYPATLVGENDVEIRTQNTEDHDEDRDHGREYRPVNKCCYLHCLANYCLFLN